MILTDKKGKALLIAATVCLFIYLGFSLFAAHVMTSRLAPHLDITPNFISNDWQAVEFEASDKLHLRGWFFPTISDKAVIMVSGLLANRTNSEYMGSIIARELISEGYNVLLYDSRAHGKSDGNRVGFGSVEGRDIVGAVKFLNSQGFESKKIAIIGDSLGAISTLMVAGQLKDVGAIVTDTPAANFRLVVSDRLWKEKRVPPFLHSTIFLFAKLFFGVDIESVKPVNKISADQNRKYLFLHGRLDETTPISNSELLLKKAGKGSKLVVFEEGSHIETYKSDPHLYRKEVFQFLTQELNK